MSNYTSTSWSNRQTWNINLRFDEMFTNMVKEQEFDDVDHLEDAFKTVVHELEFEGLKETSLAHDAVGCFLQAVDWRELAEHYADDAGLFKDEENEE